MPQQKIDIVYTWVDGRDVAWLKTKQKHHHLVNADSDFFANVNGRFRDNRELLFSLRALDQYFPEHGNVYIVTDNQVPSFLNDRVIIVDHQAIMESVPTYSSKKIESNLFKIKGLSERFIYFNDDVFLGPNFKISDYFKDNQCVIHYENNRDSAVTNTERSETNAANLSELILTEAYEDYSHHAVAMSHAPRAVIKSHYQAFINQFNVQYEISQTEIFRDKNVPLLLGDLFSRWAIHNQLASVGKVPHIYLQTTDDTSKLAQFLAEFSQYHYFCINDTSDNINDNHGSLTRVEALLNSVYPTKSRYEI